MTLKKLLISFSLFICTFSIVNGAEPVLLIFGGKDHEVFLGCLNTSKHDAKSIWNKYGDHGSKYSDKAIWNKYGEYGGKYSEYSPFNKYTSTPPVLVDNDGKFYGYFTTNESNPKRTRVRLALIVLANWEEIQEDVAKYYDLIFK